MTYLFLFVLLSKRFKYFGLSWKLKFVPWGNLLVLTTIHLDFFWMKVSILLGARETKWIRRDSDIHGWFMFSHGHTTACKHQRDWVFKNRCFPYSLGWSTLLHINKLDCRCVSTASVWKLCLIEFLQTHEKQTHVCF